VQITRETIVADTIENHPETIPVYERYSLRCHVCGGNMSDTIQDIGWNHGVNVDALLRDLNAVLSN
jgi:hybrid cluster-associated redox disulfide protein